MLFSLIIPYNVNSNKRFYSLTDCKVSLLQKVEVLNTKKSRKFVITCDLLYQTDESSGVSHNAVTIPSFSSIIYTEEGGLLRVCIVAAIIWIQYVVDGKKERRIRFLGAPLRPVESQVQTYLPYDTIEHASYKGGVKVVLIGSPDVIDTHFVFPVFGLSHMWERLDSLPEGSSFNIRGGGRAYFSLPFARFDVASAKWSNDEDTYVALPSELSRNKPPSAGKVFLSYCDLREEEARFGYDTPRGADHAIVGRPTTAMPAAPVEEDEDSVRGSERSYVSSNDEVDSIGEYEYDTDSICSDE